MIDLADVVSLVLWAFFGALALCLILALLLNKTVKDRVNWSLAVLALFALIVGAAYFKQVWYPRQVAMEEARTQGLPTTLQEHKARYEAARALFDKRCETAGEKAYRTADNVEGLLLLDVRPAGSRDANRHDPNWPDAALPDEATGDWYIRSFLSWEHQQWSPARGFLNNDPKDANGFLVSRGYAFVDVKQPDGTFYRYRFKQRPSNDLSRELLTDKPARYAVSFRNMVDSIDRVQWVAGTIVTITDTQTNETMAQKTWYSFEPGLGSSAGARVPWAYAMTCPETKGSHGRAPTRFFVDQILKPKKKEE